MLLRLKKKACCQHYVSRKKDTKATDYMVVRIVNSKGEWRVVPRYAGGQYDGSCVTRRA